MAESRRLYYMASVLYYKSVSVGAVTVQTADCCRDEAVEVAGVKRLEGMGCGAVWQYQFCHQHGQQRDLKEV
ncbi:unnamed protein product [Ambrosiozyma monospora]|uniref:Unnamed protein product n=1 Tax=Ambrosiozyma monospora TaxID=43982 RepID=A0ACB5TS48_AMBMO|nr:unnamed protein product [Ambrosiozyma monospora]